jgi:hypothetical protein
MWVLAHAPAEQDSRADRDTPEYDVERRAVEVVEHLVDAFGEQLLESAGEISVR